MDTHDTLLAAVLKILEDDGEAQFSTRAICALANVTAPTLYHHFGNIDGLLSAAIAEAFRQFLESKKAAVNSPDPVTAVRQGWDDYVNFAATRPRLYSAMLGRILKGAHVPAAEQGTLLLIDRIKAVAADGRLAGSVEAGVEHIWASANAAALLHVTAQFRKASPPDSTVIDELRDRAMQAILNLN